MKYASELTGGDYCWIYRIRQGRRKELNAHEVIKVQLALHSPVGWFRNAYIADTDIEVDPIPCHTLVAESAREMFQFLANSPVLGD